MKHRCSFGAQPVHGAWTRYQELNPVCKINPRFLCIKLARWFEAAKAQFPRFQNSDNSFGHIVDTVVIIDKVPGKVFCAHLWRRFDKARDLSAKLRIISAYQSQWFNRWFVDYAFNVCASESPSPSNCLLPPTGVVGKLPRVLDPVDVRNRTNSNLSLTT